MSDLVRDQASTSDLIRMYKRQIKELQAENAELKAAAIAGQLTPVEQHPFQAMVGKLPRGPMTLAMALYGVYPKGMETVDLNDAIYSRDHAIDRDLRIVAVYVHRIRARFGKDAIENMGWSRGYKLSERFYNEIKEGKYSNVRS